MDGAVTLELIPGSQPARKNPTPLVDPVHKIILFWMHRCGSTTGQLWFFQAAGWTARMAGKGASQIYPEWMAEHEALYRDLAPYYADPSFLKIAVVRNPLTRAVSSYSVVTDSISGSQWRAVSRSVKEPDPERRMTFVEFLDFLESTDLAAGNYHWRLQTAADWYDQNLPGIEFVRVESLQEDLDRMCKLLGRPRIPMKISSATTKVGEDLSGVDVTQLTRAELGRVFGRDRRGVIRFPDYSYFLTKDVAERLKRLYGRDMEALGYTA
jgi:hypothetical protein